MAALTEGRQLTLTAKATDCEHPLPPEVILAEGGTTSYQWVVPPGDTYDSFPTSAAVDAALLAGKDLQAAVDVTACTSPNGTLSPLLASHAGSS
ncbi:unnamed protein product [Darwinula stevensoni]|uniref:Uncharacterized protein n=1 Tax=Darwinula stevensoni TaxID=69355 RepID=A0A7R9AC38_9CRUS|nr:unnamed protein product [Darwinula stevensoni]CAG0899835.1 unnamed protein product [Darwinula stevensoni]